MQQRSAKQQRMFVEKAKAAVHEEEEHLGPSGPSSSARQPYQDQELELEEQRPSQSQQQQTQAQIEAVPDSEIEYQEQLIAEREGEIRGIEAGIHELNDIFRDLGTIVHEQQSMLGMHIGSCFAFMANEGVQTISNRMSTTSPPIPNARQMSLRQPTGIRGTEADGCAIFS